MKLTKFKTDVLLFVLIIIISSFFRLKIIRELPLGQVTNEYGLIGFDDEPAHLNYTKYLIANHKLPVLKNKITEPDALEINEFEYHQPPLYYYSIFLLVKFLSVNDDSRILLIGRYFNFVLSLLSAIVLYKIFSCIGWRKSKIFSAVSVYLLLGSSVYQYSVFGNDGLSWFLFWLIFLFIIKGTIRYSVIIIILLTLAHYTKSNILVIYPVLLFSFFIDVKKSGLNRSLLLKYSGIFILPLIFSFPWYLHNYRSYGSYFSVSTIAGEKWYFVKSLKESILKLLHMPYLFLFRMHFQPPKPLLSWFNIIPNLWLVATIILWGHRIRYFFSESEKIQLINVLLISMTAAYIYYAIPTGYTEGRLLYPGLPAFLFFMIEVLYAIKSKFSCNDNWMLIFILSVFLPSYIVAFYF